MFDGGAYETYGDGLEPRIEEFVDAPRKELTNLLEKMEELNKWVMGGIKVL